MVLFTCAAMESGDTVSESWFFSLINVTLVELAYVTSFRFERY